MKLALLMTIDNEDATVAGLLQSLSAAMAIVANGIGRGAPHGRVQGIPGDLNAAVDFQTATVASGTPIDLQRALAQKTPPTEDEGEA